MPSRKRQRIILVFSLILSAFIVVGGTFAWFTSKDEVVNTLEAENNYGVFVTENFQPVENWLPGKPETKEVSAVNTGKVDAFVRMELDNTFTVNDASKKADNIDYSKISADKKIVVTYSDESAEEIIININLADDWQENWTFNAGDSRFYLNKILSKGTTSPLLVKSVELEKISSQISDYDLTVNLQSVQKISGSDETEAVRNQWQEQVNDATVDDSGKITWYFK